MNTSLKTVSDIAAEPHDSTLHGPGSTPGAAGCCQRELIFHECVSMNLEEEQLTTRMDPNTQQISTKPNSCLQGYENNEEKYRK